MQADDPFADFSLTPQALHSLLEHMPAGIVLADASTGRIVYNNREAERLLRHPVARISSEAEYRRFGAVHDDGTPYAPEEYPLVQVLRGQEPGAREVRYVRGDGTITSLHVQASAVANPDGLPLLAAAVFFDIADRKHAEAMLRDTQRKLKLAIDIAGLGFWEWNVQTNEVYFSPQWKHQLGYRDEEVPHRFEEWQSRVHPEDLPDVMAGLASYLPSGGGDYQVQFRFRHRDGSWRWIEARAQLVRDEQGRAERMVGTHLDITDHKLREEQVRLVAQHDRLTGLPNRALTFELASHCLSAARREGSMSAILFLDLDGFKPINDAWGHHIGDEVLKEVAIRLRRSFRSHDVVGRLGGDEFLVVVAQLQGPQDAVRAASHALQQLCMPYRVGDLTLHSSPSIGISLCPRDGADIEVLVRRADAAMYEAKQRGKAGYRFCSAKDDWEAGTSDLPHRLRESLARRELQLHFQPIVDLHGRRLVSVEVLLRWQTAQGESMSPDICIALAEQSGLIGELGEWIFEQACTQHLEWQRQGLPAIPFGVNLSANQLREASLQDAVARLLGQSGIAPDKLWVEVSDRAFNGAPQHAMICLQHLKELGVRITLDDFGVGHMTLEQLSRLPLDRVKIDRTLIAALPSDKCSIAVTDAAISFGRSLGIEVVAEGLESEQVMGFLRQRECHTMQGFHLAPPMTGQRFADWYRQAGLT